MIALLRGRVAESGEDHVVIDTGGDAGGVGYLVYCGLRTLHRLPPQGQTAELRIITQVREDAITLYGFLDPGEQHWFRLLQNIQGVGARLALSVLSVLDADELTRAVSAQDRAPLTRASGVGPRLAGRIIAELKDRIGEAPLPVAAGRAAPAAGQEGGPLDDAMAALVNLGYGRGEAYTALLEARARLGEAAPLDGLIRESLKELAR